MPTPTNHLSSPTPPLPQAITDSSFATGHSSSPTVSIADLLGSLSQIGSPLPCISAPSLLVIASTSLLPAAQSSMLARLPVATARCLCVASLLVIVVSARSPPCGLCLPPPHRRLSPLTAFVLDILVLLLQCCVLVLQFHCASVHVLHLHSLIYVYIIKFMFV
ncbi:hypothetical protein PIB30_014238 [Stylosanthes scabra]|uniref:Uncharacterized protein n=1 Tax=Stylosanthes scabra TaxID=79078 RepID=A0ABU6X460_9FABA|nr:hypothetical protein [Stylosanthes scabra]